MSQSHAPSLESLELAAERRRKRQFAGTITAVAIPAVAGAAVLVASYTLVEDARSDLGEIRAEAETATIALAQTRDELDDAREALAPLRAELAQAAERKQQLQNEIQALHEERKTLVAAAEEQRVRAARAEETLGETRRTLDEAQRALEDSTRFTRSLYNLDWGDLKLIAMEFSGAERPLIQMANDRRRGLGWSMANNPEKGFHSPGYAAHVLQETGLAPRDVPMMEVLKRLKREELSRGATPETGDIVVYDSGYHLFFYRDRGGRAFVAGMTPAGIAAIDYEEFEVPRRAVLRVPRR